MKKTGIKKAIVRNFLEEKVFPKVSQISDDITDQISRLITQDSDLCRSFEELPLNPWGRNQLLGKIIKEHYELTTSRKHEKSLTGLIKTYTRLEA